VYLVEDEKQVCGAGIEDSLAEGAGRAVLG